MRNNKIEKIYEVIKTNGRALNLHEIKAMTGAGNGYAAQNTIKSSDINNTCITNSYNHKSKKINELLNTAGMKLNLYQIKAMTGAGNGYIQ